MFKWFKRKPKYQYIYLCKRCDIFFDNKTGNNICPVCGVPAKTWRVQEIQEKKD